MGLDIFYILDDKGEPVSVPDCLTWAKWFETAGLKRMVRRDQIGPCIVSTVFLSLNPNWFDRHNPLLWETMVFNGPCAGERYRCGGSREQAEAMHDKVLAQVAAEMGRKPEMKPS